MARNRSVNVARLGTLSWPRLALLIPFRFILSHAWPALAFLALIGLFFWPAVSLQGVFYYGDILRLHYPLKVVYEEAIRQGRLPLWSPEVMFGFPLFAEGQVGALYPVNFLAHIFLSLPAAINFGLLVHYLVAALGVYAFGRLLSLSAYSAAMAGIAYAFSGFLIAHLTHLNVVATAAWLPWLFYLTELLLRGRRTLVWASGLAALAGLQFLPGHGQVAVLNLLAAGAYLSVRAIGITANEGFFYGLTRFGLGAGALVVGAGLATVQLLPTYELTTASVRAGGLDPAFAVTFSLPPYRLAGLFQPYLWGDPFGTLSPATSAEWISYIGVLPLIGAVAALSRPKLPILFFASLAGAGFILALGRWTPVYPELAQLPVLNLFRVPARYLLLSTFSLALLFGFGLERLALSRQWRASTRPRPTAPTIIAILAVGVVLAAILLALPSKEGLLRLWTYLPWALWFAGLWLVLGAGLGWYTPIAWRTLAATLLVADLFAFAAVYGYTFNATKPPNWLTQTPELPALVTPGAERYRIATSLDILPDPEVMRASLYPNLSLAAGVESMDGYFPLTLGRYASLIEEIKTHQGLLDLMGARWIVIPQLVEDDPDTQRYNLSDPFASSPLDGPIRIAPYLAETIEVDSFLTHSPALVDGTPVMTLILTGDRGQQQTFTLMAGVDTAEWAYDRADVYPTLRHRKPEIARSWTGVSTWQGIEHPAYTYRTRLTLPRPMWITAVEAKPIHPRGYTYIDRVLLISPSGARQTLAQASGGSDHEIVYWGPKIAIFRNLDALPRTFVVYHVQPVESEEEEWNFVLRPEFDPRHEAVVAGDANSLIADSPAPTSGISGEEAAIARYDSTEIVVQTRLEQPGYLMLTDAYYPGWKVFVDGHEKPILRGDYLFRAVALEAGQHEVIFRYVPTSLIIGAVISLFSLGVIVVAGLIGWLRRVG